MPVLDVDVAEPGRFISFRLSDDWGRHLAAHQVRIDEHRPGLWESIFDAGGYVRRSVEAMRRVQGTAPSLRAIEEIVARAGIFIGDKVLGEAITGLICAGIEQRRLSVRFPESVSGPLWAALLRVPWELASLSSGETAGKAWLDRNVIVRAVPSARSSPVLVPLGAGELLRVLFVFADTPRSPALGMRREREQLMDLLVNEVMPERLVRAETLCHGVTREILREAVQRAGGFHIVHWSGHGRHDALQLCAAGGSGDDDDFLSGAELVELLREAGGFIPQLFFLSACDSGAGFGREGFGSLQAYLRKVDQAHDEAADVELGEAAWKERKGFSGTAFELLRAGVPQVIGMRYEVTDRFARELAAAFYRILLSQHKAHAADAALAMARSELRSSQKAQVFHPIDHATPMFFGEVSFGFEPGKKRSPALDALNPRPQPLLRGSREMDPPDRFVGRGEELSRIGESLRRVDRRAICVIAGPCGIGKTALVAEAVHLWHRHFDWVFAFQAKTPDGLALDEVQRTLHKRLLIASPPYRVRCSDNAYGALFIETSPLLDPAEREQILLDNLIALMGAERLLLVFDRLDAALGSVNEGGAFVFADPAWERFLSALADGLRAGGSRVLVTARRPLAALASGEKYVTLAVKPLRAEEAALYLEEYAWDGAALEPDGLDAKRLMMRRILEASRGHPFLLRRMCDLFVSDGNALRAVLDSLSAQGMQGLPGLAPLLAKSSESPADIGGDDLRSYLNEIVKSID